MIQSLFTTRSEKDFDLKMLYFLLLGSAIFIFSLTEEYVPSSVASHTICLTCSILIFRNKNLVDGLSGSKRIMYRVLAYLNVIAYVVCSPVLLWLWLCYGVVENSY